MKADRNSRERTAEEARTVLGDERFLAFLHSANEGLRVQAVKFILEALESGDSLDAIFYDGEDWGFRLDVDQLEEFRFSIEFGCEAGPTAGDGAAWAVEYDSQGDVVRCDISDVWMA